MRLADRSAENEDEGEEEAVVSSGDPGSGVSLPGKLTVATTSNGRVVLDNGHPLYTFVRDKTSSDANGEGINAFGGTSHAATPSLAAS